MSLIYIDSSNAFKNHPYFHTPQPRLSNTFHKSTISVKINSANTDVIEPITTTSFKDNIEIAKKFALSRFGLTNPELLSRKFINFDSNYESYQYDKYFTDFKKDFAILIRASPDFNIKSYDFQVDENNANIVWFKIRPLGTLTGPILYKGEVYPPYFKSFEYPISQISLTIDSGKVVRSTSGYVVDRFIGTTGGLTGVQGLMYAIGEPPSKFDYQPPIEIVKDFFRRARKPISKVSPSSPFSEAVMFALSKQVLSTNLGIEDTNLLSEDFQYSGPRVGIKTKAEFIAESLIYNFKEALPDINFNARNFIIDSCDPSRVWFVTESTGTHTFNLTCKGTLLSPPTGKSYRAPPEAYSFSFNDKGLCYRITGGYVLDVSQGNTQGLGGTAGILVALGHPISEFETRPISEMMAVMKKDWSSSSFQSNSKDEGTAATSISIPNRAERLLPAKPPSATVAVATAANTSASASALPLPLPAFNTKGLSKAVSRNTVPSIDVADNVTIISKSITSGTSVKPAAAAPAPVPVAPVPSRSAASTGTGTAAGARRANYSPFGLGGRANTKPEPKAEPKAQPVTSSSNMNTNTKMLSFGMDSISGYNKTSSSFSTNANTSSPPSFSSSSSSSTYKKPLNASVANANAKPAAPVPVPSSSSSMRKQVALPAPVSAPAPVSVQNNNKNTAVTAGKTTNTIFSFGKDKDKDKAVEASVPVPASKASVTASKEQVQEQSQPQPRVLFNLGLNSNPNSNSSASSTRSSSTNANAGINASVVTNTKPNPNAKPNAVKTAAVNVKTGSAISKNNNSSNTPITAAPVADKPLLGGSFASLSSRAASKSKANTSSTSIYTSTYNSKAKEQTQTTLAKTAPVSAVAKTNAKPKAQSSNNTSMSAPISTKDFICDFLRTFFPRDN